MKVLCLCICDSLSLICNNQIYSNLLKTMLIQFRNQISATFNLQNKKENHKNK